MRTLLSRRHGQVVVAVVAVVLVVTGGLWWTKTIAFTRVAMVEFNSDPFAPAYGENSSYFFNAEPFPAEGVRAVADRIAQTHGGSGRTIRI